MFVKCFLKKYSKKQIRVGSIWILREDWVKNMHRQLYINKNMVYFLFPKRRKYKQMVKASALQQKECRIGLLTKRIYIRE